MIVKGIPAVRFNGPCWKLGPQVVTSLKYTLLIREWLSKRFLLLEISPRCCIGTVRPQKAICCPLFHVILSVCIKTISCFGLRSSAESNPHERERQRKAYKCIFIEVQYSNLASKLHLCKLQTLYTYFIHFILFYFFKDVSKPPEGVHGFESRSLLLEDPLTAVDGHGPSDGGVMDDIHVRRTFICPRWLADWRAFYSMFLEHSMVGVWANMLGCWRYQTWWWRCFIA